MEISITDNYFNSNECEKQTSWYFGATRTEHQDIHFPGRTEISRTSGIDHMKIITAQTIPIHFSKDFHWVIP